jgi:lysozyme
VNLSPAGESLIKGFECPGGKPNLTPYKDGGGVWTWGFGHAKGPHEVVPSSITAEQAQDIFDDDTGWAVDDVNALLRSDVPQNVFDALVSFLFNVGLGQLRQPPHRTLDAIVAQDWATAGTRMLTWCHDNGKYVQGLYNRREKEVALLQQNAAPTA